MSQLTSKKEIVLPETMNITVPYNVGQRLRYFGSHESTYADILTAFMDAGDRKCRLDKVTKPKEWMRQGIHYEKLLAD
jgi:hypothetical protein